MFYIWLQEQKNSSFNFLMRLLSPVSSLVCLLFVCFILSFVFALCELDVRVGNTQKVCFSSSPPVRPPHELAGDEIHIRRKAGRQAATSEPRHGTRAETPTVCTNCWLLAMQRARLGRQTGCITLLPPTPSVRSPRSWAGPRLPTHSTRIKNLISKMEGAKI
jgi:hypothetical protein